MTNVLKSIAYPFVVLYMVVIVLLLTIVMTPLVLFGLLADLYLMITEQT